MDTTQQQITQLLDKASLTDLIIRYFAAADDKRLNLAIVETIFSGDGRVIRPRGNAMTGPKEILEGHTRSFDRFKTTHHVITNPVIDINGNAASIRANMTAMHAWADSEINPALNGKYFYALGVLSAKAVKIDDTWRISEMANKVVWREGDGMAEMLSFEKTLKQVRI